MLAATFWPDFFTQLFATLIAVAIGIPVGLWIHQRRMTQREARPPESRRDELARAADILATALDANRSRLQRLAQVMAQHQAMHDTGLDVSAWEAVQPYFASASGSSAIRPRLAYHFSRVATVQALSDRLLRYTIGPESGLDGAPQVRRQLQDAISSTAAELDREAGQLAVELRQLKTNLPAVI